HRQRLPRWTTLGKLRFCQVVPITIISLARHPAAPLITHMLCRARFNVPAHIAQIVAIAVLFPHIAAPAQADETSAWDKTMHSAVRLIAASAARDGGQPTLRAGIEIRLDKGWKTYWRYPGDSGVPPRFDFTRSENVKS